MIEEVIDAINKRIPEEIEKYHKSIYQMRTKRFKLLPPRYWYAVASGRMDEDQAFAEVLEQMRKEEP